MARFHVTLGITMALCAFGAITGFLWKNVEVFLWIGFAGYWVGLIAIVVGAFIVLLFGYQALRRKGAVFWSRHWLGVVNGIVAAGLLAWATHESNGIVWAERPIKPPVNDVR
jgi:ABC-type branched-subunit amino acid transport system permease subunit